tara:strand:+ start:310 stop:708 length:399 start_codon:yes stop_codon:yes gene_type:complete
MKIKRIQKTDFDTISKWWLDWGLEIPEEELLPEKGTGGWMISDNEIPVAAGYLYFTNTRIGYIDFLISNPEYREKDRNEMIVDLIDYMVKFGIKRGCKFIWATSDNKHVTDKCKKLNYKVLDKKYNIIYKYE